MRRLWVIRDASMAFFPVDLRDADPSSWTIRYSPVNVAISAEVLDLDLIPSTETYIEASDASISKSLASGMSARKKPWLS